MTRRPEPAGHVTVFYSKGGFLLIFVWVMCDGGTKRWYHALQNRIFDSASAPFPADSGGRRGGELCSGLLRCFAGILIIRVFV